MNKAQLLQTTVQINNLSHDGRGIAEIDGKTTFVCGAMPKETVTCQITKNHARFNEATAIEVIEPSPGRIKPACAHFSICGGCNLQHMDTDAQIQFKQQVLLEQLLHFGKVKPEKILPPLLGNPWHYRRKARLGVRYVRKKQRVLVGFREKQSRYLADIQECPVLHKTVGLKITALSLLIQSLVQCEAIPQIEVAVGDEITALVFRHLETLPSDDIAKLSAFGQEHDLHIYLQPNSPATMARIWPAVCDKTLSYKIPAHDLTMEFHPLDFIQINGETNLLLIEKALELLAIESHETVLDLFCGLGNFTLPMARKAKFVIGIEGSADMVERANANASLNQMTNCDFFTANLAAPETIVWPQQTFDKILLDPPRTGAKEILSHIAQLQPKKIVYVSCNPATLARDAGELVYTHKYRLASIGIINMFPHTSHVETIALFER